MAKKKNAKSAKTPAAPPKTTTEPAIPEILHTPEFTAAWATWRRFTQERGIDLTKEDAARQLQLLAKLGPDKAIADIHKTMQAHPLQERVPNRANPAKPKAILVKSKARSDKDKPDETMAGPEAAKAKPSAAKAKPDQEARVKKMSALDAAAKVLAETGQVMSCQELIQAMAAKGFWTSPGGLTPQATLYSAMQREIGKKGSQARFRKAQRGRFEFVGK